MTYRILHLLARMDRGGAETFVMNVFREIDKQKFEFDFLLNSPQGDYVEEIKQLGGRIYSIAPRSQGLVKYCRALSLFFAEHHDEYQAVHMHTSSLSSLEFLYYSRRYGIPVRIIHSHSTVQNGSLHNILHWLQKPVISKLATDYLACSEVAANWLYKMTGINDKAIVIRNGIDVAKFTYRDAYRAEVRKKYGILPDVKLLGHVGRFETVKNQTFLVDIFKEYHEIAPNSMLLMVGSGSHMDAVKKKVADVKLQDSVIFAGVQSEIYKFLSAFDYFVFPSLYEGLPVSLVEAQASGVLTICSDRVSQECKLTEALSFFPLDRSAKEWATYIHSIAPIPRESTIHDVIQKGYSITETTNFLTKNIYR